MNLQEVGAQLRLERERLGLSVEEVMERTKISRRNLDAIEEGKEGDLPHLVYARGFVKNYARLLGLDAEHYGRLLTQALGGGQDPYEDFQATDQKTIPLTVKESALRRYWGLAVLVLVAGVLGAGGYFLFDFVSRLPSDISSMSRTEAPAAPVIPAKAESVQPSQPSQSLQGSQAAVAPADKAQAAPVAEKPADKVAQDKVMADKASPDKTAPEKIAPEKVTADKTAADKPAAEKPQDKPQAAADKPAEQVAGASQDKPAETAVAAAAVDPVKPKATAKTAHLVEVSAKEASWLKVLSDGDSKSKEYFLKPGETLKLPFSKVLMVKLGNAGGVSLTYDGAPYQMSAQSGQVKTVSFP